jgi:glycosyltransferase involved in cell wall biosynthesis
LTNQVVVVVPAFNAATSIAWVVGESLVHGHPVVVVDDGSSDATGEVARAAGALVLRHALNRGKGAALKTAFAWALQNDFEGVVSLDADGQHLPSEIPRILGAAREEDADLVIGGRAHLFGEMLPRRRLANRFSAWTIAWASRTGVTDSQSGFRYYSARLLRGIHLQTDGFDLESEVIVRAGLRGMRIVVTPIELGFIDGISTSHYKPLMDSLRIAWTVFRARFIWK